MIKRPKLKEATHFAHIEPAQQLHSQALGVVGESDTD